MSDSGEPTYRQMLIMDYAVKLFLHRDVVDWPNEPTKRVDMAIKAAERLVDKVWPS